MVENANLALRYGVTNLLKYANTNKFPLILVSAGVKEVIEASVQKTIELLQPSSTLDDFSIKVLSNHFEYDGDKVVGYNKDIVHSQNKGEFVTSTCKDQIEPLLRDNIILMGDIEKDLQMVVNENHKEVLTIGYLNEASPSEETIERYSTSFDIVITGDGPLTPVNLILYHITGKTTGDYSYFDAVALDGLKDCIYHRGGKHPYKSW